MRGASWTGRHFTRLFQLLSLSQARKPAEGSAKPQKDVALATCSRELGVARIAELGEGFQPWWEGLPCYKIIQCPSMVDGQSKPQDSKESQLWVIWESPCCRKGPGAFWLAPGDVIREALLATSEWQHCDDGNGPAVSNCLALSWAPWSPHSNSAENTS